MFLQVLTCGGGAPRAAPAARGAPGGDRCTLGTRTRHARYFCAERSSAPGPSPRGTWARLAMSARRTCAIERATRRVRPDASPRGARIVQRGSGKYLRLNIRPAFKFPPYCADIALTNTARSSYTARKPPRRVRRRGVTNGDRAPVSSRRPRSYGLALLVYPRYCRVGPTWRARRVPGAAPVPRAAVTSSR